MFQFFFYWRYNPLWVCILQPSSGVIASSRTRFLDHTQRRATVGRTPLEEWSVRRRDLYLTTHNTHNRQTSMTPVGFEPTISEGEWLQTNALGRAATGIGEITFRWRKMANCQSNSVPSTAVSHTNLKSHTQPPCRTKIKIYSKNSWQRSWSIDYEVFDVNDTEVHDKQR